MAAGEPEAKKAKVDGESYYKVIDGVKYDRALLVSIESFAADGQVGYPEAKKLWIDAEDGKGITDTERATIEYAMKTYKFTVKAKNFLQVNLTAGTFKSYYKVIDGCKYDRALLEDAQKFAADGQISWKEAKTLFEDAQDGKGLTDTEKDTIKYAMKTLKFTDKARKYLEKQLSSPTSYYKVIDGVKYDRALLVDCEEAMKDGVISEAEAKKLYESACDGKGVTEIEKITLKYALKTFKFADEGKTFLEKSLEA